MADNSQVANLLRAVAEAADGGITTKKINDFADEIAADPTPDAFYYAPNASDYGHPTSSSIYIDSDHNPKLSRGIIVPADDVGSEPRKWSWEHRERCGDSRGAYTYESVAEAWEQAHK